MKNGDILNERYLVKKQIGEGGMAKVFLAKDTYLNRDVAIKCLKTLQDAEQQKRNFVRFQREIKSLVSLQNRNVVQVYDVVDRVDENKNQVIYIVMEYVSSQNLKDVIKNRAPLNYVEALYIFSEILNCIQEAHSKNIIHRDLKPHNVLIAGDGLVKIVDFGIALINDGVELTGTNNVVGSIQYIAPEILQSNQPSFQSDIYALGVILYEMVVGKPPFTGKNIAAIAKLHVNSSVPSVLSTSNDIPEGLDMIIQKSTAKDLSARYKSIDEIKRDADLVQKGETIMGINKFNKNALNNKNSSASALSHEVPIHKNFILKKGFIIALYIALGIVFVVFLLLLLDYLNVLF